MAHFEMRGDPRLLNPARSCLNTQLSEYVALRGVSHRGLIGPF